jgi:hypothetical protein
VVFRFRDRKGISAIPPEQYMHRFQARVVQEVRLRCLACSVSQAAAHMIDLCKST